MPVDFHQPIRGDSEILQRTYGIYDEKVGIPGNMRGQDMGLVFDGEAAQCMLGVCEWTVGDSQTDVPFGLCESKRGVLHRPLVTEDDVQTLASSFCLEGLHGDMLSMMQFTLLGVFLACCGSDDPIEGPDA